jgi:hypothetical protein
MQDVYHIRNTHFLLRWVLSGYLAWLIGGVLSVAAGFIGFFAAMILSGVLQTGVPSIAYWVVAVFVGMSTGYAIGTLQQWLIRHLLHWEVDHWTRWSTIGGAAAGLAVYGLLTLSDRMLQDSGTLMVYPSEWHQPIWNIVTLLPLMVFVGLVALFQWRILRQYVRAAWLWVLANVAGGWMFTAVFAEDGTLMQWAIGVFALSAATGAVMLYLFQTQVHRSNLPEGEGDSIWDRAV